MHSASKAQAGRRGPVAPSDQGGRAGGGRSAEVCGGRAHGVGKVCLGLLWKGPGGKDWLQGMCLQENSGLGCTVSKPGSKCWCCVGSHRCPCVYAGRNGERNSTCQLSCYWRNLPKISAPPAQSLN